MTTEAKKTKILAAIAARGWFTADIYINEAFELRAAGVIKMGSVHFSGQGFKSAWVAA